MNETALKDLLQTLQGMLPKALWVEIPDLGYETDLRPDYHVRIVFDPKMSSPHERWVVMDLGPKKGIYVPLHRLRKYLSIHLLMARAA